MQQNDRDISDTFWFEVLMRLLLFGLAAAEMGRKLLKYVKPFPSRL